MDDVPRQIRRIENYEVSILGVFVKDDAPTNERKTPQKRIQNAPSNA